LKTGIIAVVIKVRYTLVEMGRGRQGEGEGENLSVSN
jgi:hypothetical protein